MVEERTGERHGAGWHVRGRAGAGLVAMGTLLATCGGNESALEVIYQVWDADSNCYQTCGTIDPPADLGVTDTCDTGPAACEIVLGETTVRVIALYDNVRFDEPLTAPAPAFMAYIDGNEWAGGGADPADWIPHRRNPHEAWFELYRNLPYATGDSLWFRVLAANDFFQDSVRFKLRPPALSVTIESCPEDGDCELPAGLGQATVLVEGPAYVDEPVTAWERSNGVKVAGTEQEVALSRTSSERGQGELAFAVPGTASTVWEIVVQVADLSATSQPVHVRRPEDIELAVSATKPTAETADFGGEPHIDRSAGDLETCRQLYIAVETPDMPPAGTVDVTTSFGVLEGKAAGNPVTLSLDGTGFATGLLTWDPPDDGSTTIQVQAVADGLETRTLSFDLEPVYSDSAVLLPPPAPVQVSAAGSEETRLSGWFVAPEGAEISPDLEAWVVVGATASSTSEPLPCGTPIPAAYLQCDPGRLTGSDAGGCLLTPDGVTLDPDGTFHVTLTSGVCFAGEVTVAVHGYRYLESEGCLGERAVSSTPEMLAEVTATYVASSESSTPAPGPETLPTPTLPPSGVVTPTPGL